MKPTSDNFFPVWESGRRTVNAISDQEWGKATNNAVDAFFYLTGLPAEAKHDIEKAIRDGKWERLLGVKGPANK